VDEQSDFAARVYALVAQVPEGMVTTYGAIAAALGDPRKAREVGWALKNMPDEVDAPAHRVVNREGALSGGWAFGGPEVQRRLLEEEGVRFFADDRVDMTRHFWAPPGQAPEKVDPRQGKLF
jgi:methylated-DNA-protein-cysteine methyltransferase-like protein